MSKVQVQVNSYKYSQYILLLLFSYDLLMVTLKSIHDDRREVILSIVHTETLLLSVNQKKRSYTPILSN